MFRPWAADANPDIELCIVQLPGRETRWSEPPWLRMDEVCGAVAAAIRPALDEPFAFFGHSLGALLAFEVSRLLRSSMRVAPRCLAIAAHRAPHLPNRLPRISHLPDAAFVSAIGDRHGALPGAVETHRELMDLMLPTLRADYQMAEAYEYVDGEPLPCPITAFGGADDRCVGENEIVAWRPHTSARFVHRMLPGSHFFLDALRGNADCVDAGGSLRALTGRRAGRAVAHGLSLPKTRWAPQTVRAGRFVAFTFRFGCTSQEVSGTAPTTQRAQDALIEISPSTRLLSEN